MTKLYVSLVAVVFIFTAAIAFAGPWGPGAINPSGSADQQKFFDETRDLRRQMHEKRFELMELYRNPEADRAQAEALEKEIGDLQAKIRDKAGELKIAQGYGFCGNSPQGSNCPGYQNQTDYRSGPQGNCWQKQSLRGRGMGYGRMMW